MRENNRIVSKALMIAVATTTDGHRDIIGFDVYDNESNMSWIAFMTSLKTRGLTGLQMITSDSNPAILYAISRVFPTVAWQRCQTHFSKNVLEKTPHFYKKGLQAELLEMYNASSIEKARAIRDRIINDYNDVAPATMECLDNGFENIMTVMVLPENVRRFHRTSNHLERLNREVKRRSDVIGVFPNTESIIRLIGSVLIEINEMYGKKSTAGYPRDTSLNLKSCIIELQAIAAEQKKLLAA